MKRDEVAWGWKHGKKTAGTYEQEGRFFKRNRGSVLERAGVKRRNWPIINLSGNETTWGRIDA